MVERAIDKCEIDKKIKPLLALWDTISKVGVKLPFSEGLSGTGEYSIPSEEVKELHNQITDNLLKAYDDINILLKAVEEKEETGQTLIFNPVGGATEINAVKDCEVYHVREAEGINGTEIVFHNTQSGMYRNLLIDDDGELSMSQWY